MEPLDEARWGIYCKPYLNPFDRAIKMCAREFAAVLATEYADHSNDAAIFAHCLATVQEEIKKVASFIRSPPRFPRMTSTIKMGSVTVTIAYHFEGTNLKTQVTDNPLKHKL
ncbi:hypothetical protein PV04_09743 [Phialophora macrospora]|uniref:Uncharacterized protein n=1 Tax=Phialophora macrospora TaxID=1851006 RepID=A0A0D2CCQ4_9EURO|nr:hypothetical protein PV04_09743 [Phialophora macrospora]